MSLTPGTRLGVYEITALIGIGGMGEVYKATDTNLKRAVAIKVLPALVAADAERLARFQREAEVLAALNHPNIAQIHGLEKSDGITALVMELVEGDDLSQRIARGAIPLDEALPIAKQIADALEAAHEQGIIHRDLKPANIKVRSDGTVKVLDFGLAKAMEPAAGSSPSMSRSPTITTPAMTQAGMILGTAAYMSPEQARGRTVDKRADIWAFGAVLFEMLTGTRAFPGEDPLDTLAAIVKVEPNWDDLDAHVPPRVRQVVHLCLQKDPRRRAHDIADVRLALDGAFDTAAPQVAAPAPVSTRGRQTEYVAWGLFAVATLLAIGVSVFNQRAPRPTQERVRFTIALPPDVRSVESVGFAVSPDGHTLAFGGVGADGVTRAFVRPLDAAEVRPLAAIDRRTSLFWSPDSRSLGFSWEGGLYVVGLDGSAPRRLCDLPAVFRGGSWGSHGAIVFAPGVGGLLRIPDTGGTPTPVTTLDANAKEVAHLEPWFLPDGRHLLFLALTSGKTLGTIWATSIDDPLRSRIVESNGGAAFADGWLLSTTDEPRSLDAAPFDPRRLTLAIVPQPVRDRLAVANIGGLKGFSVSANGTLVVDRPPPTTSRLSWLDRSGRTLATVGPRGSINSFALAADERRVVAEVVDMDAGKADLWLFDTGRDNGMRLTSEGRTRRPLWALDDRHIYFTQMPGYQLRSLAVGAAQATPFDKPGPFVHFEDVTKDGRYVVFKTTGIPSEIGIQSVTGGSAPRVVVQGPFAATQARVSRDGRWLAYTLSISSRTDVFVQPLDRPGDRVQVSVKGGSGPVWRDDGKELFYEGPEGLMAVPVREDAGQLVLGTPLTLFPLRTQGYVGNTPHNVEVAAHGQKFLVNSVVDGSADAALEVTLSWMTGLKP